MDDSDVALVDRPDQSPPPNMLSIPGGTFRMGSDKHYPEEAPVHRVTVDGFWIDRTPVTNRQFKQFVRATGHDTFRGNSARSEELSRCAAAYALCRLARIHTAATSGRSERLGCVVGISEGRELAAPLRPEE